MCFDFGIISGPIIAGLSYLGGGSAVTGAGLVATTAATVASTAVTAVGQNQAAKAQAAANRYNASIAETEALDAERRGSMAEAERRNQSKRIIGAYRAEAGGSGVNPDTGSGGDVLAQAAEYGGRDAAIARLNGGREAFGLRSQAGLDRYEARAADALGTGRVAGTALTGASKVFEQTSPWWSSWQTKDDPFNYFTRTNYGYNN